jgi:hypothetical protein
MEPEATTVHHGEFGGKPLAASMRKKELPRDKPYSVFLNIPYDAGFQNLFLAYIAGLSAFNLKPRATSCHPPV